MLTLHVPLDAPLILAAAAIGAGSTLLMDLWNLLLHRAFGLRSLDYCLLGRWVAHMPAGTFRHRSIAAAARRPLECPLGWMVHYGIGVSLATCFVLLTSGRWLQAPTMVPALLYGLATVVFPFFVLQPSLGLGVASSRAPRPLQTRLKSLGTHAVFGLGLYLCGLGWHWIARPT